jgi:hypothetical protein
MSDRRLECIMELARRRRGERSDTVSEKDAVRGADVGDRAGAGSPPAATQRPALTDEEKMVLDLLVTCRTARTVAQVCAGARVSREQAAGALDSLRSKGLVTRFNTLVESYAARFPGVEV